MSNELEYHNILGATLRARLVDTGMARTTPAHQVHRCDRRSAGAAAAEWQPQPGGRGSHCGRPLQPRHSSGRHRPQRRMNATRAATSAVWPRSDGLSRHAIFLSGVATHRRALKARRFPRTSCKETRRPNPLRSASHRSPPRTDVPPMHRRAAARRRCIGPKHSKGEWGSDSRSLLTGVIAQ